MKNKTVEMMVRTQFNVDVDTDVNVEFLCFDKDGHHFEVWWYDCDILNRVNCVLPHLIRQSKNMTTNEVIEMY